MSALANLAFLKGSCASAAIWMAETWNWNCFPVGPDKKPFAGTRGFKDASADAAHLREAFGQRANANVGVATGVASGIFVVDVDVKDLGMSGFEAFEQANGKLPATLMSITPSGGRHYYFRMPVGVVIRNTTNLDDLKIDIRGEGGYVLAPPSFLRSGGNYVWANDLPIAEAPAWLIARLTANDHRRRQVGPSPTRQGDVYVGEGGRNDAAFKLACQLHRDQLPEDAVYAAVYAWNQTNCTPPLDRSELDRTIASALTYDAFALSDLGNTRRLVTMFGGDFRYSAAQKCWYWYDGKQWVRDDGSAVMRICKRMADELYADARKLSDADVRKARIAFAIKSQSAPRLNAAIELAQTEPGVPVDFGSFDCQKHLLNVANGTIDLRSGELLPHSREHLITHLIPVNFEPKALCPVFDRFISGVFSGDIELVNYCQRTFGYGITGETRDQAFWILHGAGSNGKTTMLNVITDLLGDLARHTPTDTLVSKTGAASNDLARLAGARFVTASEANADQRLADALVKQITGDEPITARFLFKEHFTFRPQFKLFLATNQLPQLNGADPAMWRRVRLIPFNRVFQPHEQDRELGSKLAAEMPGILAWLVRGAQLWYTKPSFALPKAVQLAGAEYRSSSDTVGVFLEERCDLVAGVEVGAKALAEAYTAFTDKNGGTPLNPVAFGLALSARGISPIKRSGYVYRTGLRFKAPSISE